MGILNVTPDSFSDGGKFLSIDKAVDRAHEMVMEGATLIDIGGESTRPGALSVTESEELERVLPVIETLSKALPVPISIDTSKPQVMTEAVKSGASFINDVRALQEQGAIQTAKKLDVPICLMHMQGKPRSMQQEPGYKNVTEEVKSFLLERVELCEAAGIEKTKIVIDPGIGFGKSLEHNLSILTHLSEFVELGLPVLIGVSRKSMIGALLDEPADKRLFGGIALTTAACLAGVSILRTHDVKATSDALKICQALIHSK
jgi:dihydropteroate synthase